MLNNPIRRRIIWKKIREFEFARMSCEKDEQPPVHISHVTSCHGIPNDIA
jgi:hypothetical protein